MPDDFNPGNVRAKLKQAGSDARAGVDRGIRLAAEHLLKTSRDIVPIEEGTLERSGKVSVDEATHTAAVSFSTPYAVIQHEDLTFAHDPGRHAKYLETPMHAEAAVMAQLAGGEVKREMGL